jgi:SAM-dependent methyltransferase
MRVLQSEAGAQLLTELATADLSDKNTLPLLTRLRKTWSPEVAAAALETARLRLRAADKMLPSADLLWLTRDGLEQASHGATAVVRRIDFADCGTVFDLGCGIGADSMALAPECDVVAMDNDPLRLAMAQANTGQVSGKPVYALQADLRSPLPFDRDFMQATAAFFDPARRAEGRRLFSVHDYLPPLEVAAEWPFAALQVKLSPGVDLSELIPYAGSVHFVSVNGELKEAQLCLGAWASRRSSAKVLTVDWTAAQPQDAITLITLISQDIAAPETRSPKGYLYEPDPAVIRAGLLGELAAYLDIPMYRFDETIAYLTADFSVETPLARVWPIEDALPFNVKKLRAYLRERHIGRVTVKKRGHAMTPEELIAALRLPGDGEDRVVVLTRVMGQPFVLICKPR